MLACWCHPKQCHGDTLIELLEAQSSEYNTCYYCRFERTNGKHGCLQNNIGIPVCKFCYEHIAQFRRSTFEWTQEHIDNSIKKLNLEKRRIELAIKKYENKQL